MKTKPPPTVGALLSDNAIAAKLLELSKIYGVKVIWVAEPEKLPLTVQAVVSSRKEAVKAPPQLRTLYVEDYPSIECLLLNLVAGTAPGKPKSSLVVALNLGRAVGAAYAVDGYIVKTGRYNSLTSFESDCNDIISCIGEGRKIEFYIGYRPEEIVQELASRLRKQYPGAKIMFIPDVGGGPEFRELSPDEASALKIYLKAVSENI
ncbi:MAG: hypothetical protein QXO86_02490 [Nitrososphaerota archaeon]